MAAQNSYFSSSLECGKLPLLLRRIGYGRPSASCPGGKIAHLLFPACLAPRPAWLHTLRSIIPVEPTPSTTHGRRPPPPAGRGYRAQSRVSIGGHLASS